jgi:putative ATP-binding cassette transporter
MDRLKGLQTAIDSRPATALDVVPQPGATTVGSDSLTLALPDGRPLLENTSVQLPKGQATLISGVSGSGKSTLFRALAGIWPFGRGHVQVPAGARVLFLPQKPYIPIGTLRDAVKYPDEQSTASDAEIADALTAVNLGHLAGRLGEEAHWGNTLSGGEQQRLAAARALVFKPDWLFMDEATASLDDAAETAVYESLKRQLPTTTMVSIGHRPTLQKWHDRRLELQRAPGEIGRLVETPLPAPA